MAKDAIVTLPRADASLWETHRPGEEFMGGVITGRLFAFVVVEYPDGSHEKIQIAPLPND